MRGFTYRERWAKELAGAEQFPDREAQERQAPQFISRLKKLFWCLVQATGKTHEGSLLTVQQGSTEFGTSVGSGSLQPTPVRHSLGNWGEAQKRSYSLGGCMFSSHTESMNYEHLTLRAGCNNLNVMSK